jgi:hypothetical protein
MQWVLTWLKFAPLSILRLCDFCQNFIKLVLNAILRMIYRP